MKSPTETDLVKACLKYLGTVRGVFAWRNNTGAVVSTYKGKTRLIRYGLKGSSDILGSFCGRFLAVEAKQPGERPTFEQAAFLDAIRATGGLALVVHDVMDLVRAIEMESKT